MKADEFAKQVMLIVDQDARNVIRTRRDQMLAALDDSGSGDSTRRMLADNGKEWVNIFANLLLMDFDR